jgi:hypothetical protein
VIFAQQTPSCRKTLSMSGSACALILMQRPEIVH